ncbi:hypothetical protein NSP_40270 [Nodularia spumigena CCY9414]|nr:hypothetical protein NSP_40270 [Nodularia spumigena CCY9414]
MIFARYSSRQRYANCQRIIPCSCRSPNPETTEIFLTPG